MSDQNTIPAPYQQHVTQQVIELDEAIKQLRKKVNNRQFKFAQEYASNGLNATQAALSAGYSEVRARQQGSRLLVSNGDVCKLVEKFSEKSLLLHGVDKDTIARSLWNLHQLTATPGEHFQPGAAVRSAHEINLMAGNHAPKEVRHDGNVKVALQYNINTVGAGDALVIDVPALDPEQLEHSAQPMPDHDPASGAIQAQE